MKKYILLFLFSIFYIICVNAAENVYVDDFISAESPISAAKLGISNVSLYDRFLPEALLFNPSFLSDSFTKMVSFNSSELIQNANNTNFFVVFPMFKGSLGLGYSAMSLDGAIFKEADEYGNLTGNSFDVDNKFYVLSFGKRLKLKNNFFNLGISFRLLEKTVAKYSEKGYSDKIEVNYLFLKKFRIIHSLSNLSSGKIGDDKLPLRILNSVNINILDDFTIVPEFELVKSRLDYRIGLKYELNKYFDIYSGYQKDRISCGLGINYHDFKFNYAVQINSNELSSEVLNSFGLTWLVGYSKKNRLQIFYREKNKIKELTDAEKYEESLKLLIELKKVLNEKADQLELFYVNSSYKQIKEVIKTRELQRKNNEKEIIDSINNIRKKVELESIENSFRFIQVNLDALKLKSNEYFKGKYNFEIKKLRVSAQFNYMKVLQIKFEKSKDILRKIDLLKKIIKYCKLLIPGSTTEMKKQLNEKQLYYTDILNKLNSVKNNFMFQIVDKDNSQDIKTSFSKQMERKILMEIEEGRFETAKNYLETARTFLQNSNWNKGLEKQLMNSIINEKNKVLSSATSKDNDYFVEARKALITENYKLALRYLENVSNKNSDGYKKLYKDVFELLRKKNIDVKKFTSKYSATDESKEKIKKLLFEIKRCYIEEKFDVAKTYIDQALKIDNNNTEVLRYKKFIDLELNNE
jgi:hypothetical protein